MLNQLSRVECPNITFIEEDFPVVLRKGAGMNLWDVNANKYADFTSCFGVAALGHRPKVTLTAMRKQASKLIHGMGDVHPTESKIRLLTLLSQMLPYSRPNTILSSTGSEAIDTALKTAVLATGRHRFIGFSGSYHGLMTGPLRINSRDHFTAGFEKWLEPTAKILPFPEEGQSLSALEDELKKREYAAIVLEPVQGRGGDRCFPKKYVKDACALAKQFGTLVIFDEIFTGFGRTGTMFAYEHFDVVPDIICLGKALGGGMPLSACAGDVLEVWGKSTGEARHTSTFLGHPLACAMGFAAIQDISKKLPRFVEELSAIELEFQAFEKRCRAQAWFAQSPFVLTGKGFMRGINFINAKPGFAFEVTKKLLKEGFIILPCGENGTVLSVTPPLIAKFMDYRRLFKAIEGILSLSKSD